MSLNTTTLNVSLTAGEANTFGAVAVNNENFTHQPACVSTPLVTAPAAARPITRAN